MSRSRWSPIGGSNRHPSATRTSASAHSTRWRMPSSTSRRRTSWTSSRTRTSPGASCAQDVEQGRDERPRRRAWAGRAARGGPTTASVVASDAAATTAFQKARASSSRSQVTQATGTPGPLLLGGEAGEHGGLAVAGRRAREQDVGARMAPTRPGRRPRRGDADDPPTGRCGGGPTPSGGALSRRIARQPRGEPNQLFAGGARPSCRSETGDRLDPAVVDGRLQRGVVCLGAVGVRLGELWRAPCRSGPTARGSRRSRCGRRSARGPARASTRTAAAYIARPGRHHPLDAHGVLPVAQLADEEVALGAVEAA